MMTPAQSIATFFGLGYAPFAPGSLGSLVGLLLTWGLFEAGISLTYLALVLFGIVTLGIFTSAVMLKQKDQSRDPSCIIIDEVAGMQLTLLLLLSIYPPFSFAMAILAYLSFRLFDIFKPWPISWIEKKLAIGIWPAAIGIMLDDLLAAVPAAGLTLILLGCIV